MVTGGIGGVHRFYDETMGTCATSCSNKIENVERDGVLIGCALADISTDLMELARTPVAVVCAGVKSILDIPRTLEVLETHVRSKADGGVEADGAHVCLVFFVSCVCHAVHIMVVDWL